MVDISKFLYFDLWIRIDDIPAILKPISTDSNVVTLDDTSDDISTVAFRATVVEGGVKGNNHKYTKGIK